MRGDLMLRPRPSSVGITPQLHCSHRRSLVVTSSSASKLRDPARLHGSSKSTIPLHDYGGVVSLENFMHLPPSHYSDIDPDLIESLGGNRFRLCVPRVTLFSLWIEPIVDISVSSATPHNPRVLLTSECCRLLGSERVEKMRLDDRFTLHFSTELTWSTDASTSTNGTNGNTPEKLLPNSQISSNLELEVFTEVIPPFHLLPRSVLEGTCNAVLKGLMKTLLPRFMRLLADDYTKWATDSDYRHGRTGVGSGAGAGLEAGAGAEVKK